MVLEKPVFSRLELGDFDAMLRIAGGQEILCTLYDLVLHLGIEIPEIGCVARDPYEKITV